MAISYSCSESSEKLSTLIKIDNDNGREFDCFFHPSIDIYIVESTSSKMLLFQKCYL